MSDEEPTGRDETGEGDAPETTEFLLDDWSVEDRAMLDRLLTGEGIPHAWQGGTLVVPTPTQYIVDELIDQVEVTTGAGAEPAGGGDADREPSDEAGGGDGGATHEFVDDEWGDEAWDDEVDAQEVLGEAFLAADRLARRASDPEGVLALVEVRATMTSMALPFGFDEPIWTDLVAAVGLLAAALTAEDGSAADLGDERIEELAEDLRARLRPLV